MLLTFLVTVAVAIVQMENLFSVVMLSSLYGLLSASFFTTIDAVDVALTEAAVGAGIATLLMLTTIARTGREEPAPHHKPVLAKVVVLVTGGLLIYGTLDMPYFGAPEAPSQRHVAPRYLNESIQEIGVPNMVTSVLASYRGFDTLGEVMVIFTAGVGVMSLLSLTRRPKSDADIQTINRAMHNQHLILRVTTKKLIPYILLFALYVQFHGDYGPGGGFQAGVIFAAAIILYAMLFGLGTAHRVIKQTFVQLLCAIGVLLFGGVGVASLLNGGNFLDYNVLSSDPVTGQQLGILLIELGIGCTVAAVMIVIYVNFSGRTRDLQS